jgi:hypothetical protein
LIALKLDTVFAPFRVSPPAELVASNAPLIRPEPLSVIAPLDVSDTLLVLPAATLPIMLIAPALLIETLPVPASLIPVTVKGAAVFVSEIPPFASVALKLVTVLALFKVVPVSETVASNPPLIKFVLISLIAPAAAVRETLPPVLILPPFKVTLSPAVAEIAPVVLPTFAPTRILLLAPVALSMTLPEPLALTVLPMVSVPPVAVNEILPFNPVLIAPPVVNAPLFMTLISPAPVSLIPVTNKGAAVFVREIPPPASVALKLVTVLALPKLVPAPEFVVSNAPLIKFAFISLSAPTVAVRETLPLVLILPPFRVRLSPAVAAITPEVLLTFAPTRMLLAAPVALRVMLPEPLAVTILPNVSVPPVAVNKILPIDPVLMTPLVVNAPLFVTFTSPVPVSLIPVTVRVDAVFLRETPLPASVALKLVTVLALPKLVPAAETVVSNAPLIKFVLISLIAPAVAVREILPLVLTLPPFRVMLSPAEAEITPEVLLTFAPTRMLLAAPVAVSVTVPRPPAVTVLPSVSVPLAVNEMVPESVLIAPLVVNASVLATTTLPPPLSLMPVIVSGALVFVS